MNEQLTITEKRQLLAVLRELDQHAPCENRREPRRKVLLELRIRPIAKRLGDPLKAQLRNISRNGLSMFIGRSFEVGSRFIVPLRFEDGGGWLALCEVRNCRRTADGYVIGSQLSDHIDDPKGTSTAPMDWLL